MQKIVFKLFYLIYLIPYSLVFPNKSIAGIGDRYICEDFANSYYQNQNKESRKNYKFFIQWEKNTILKKFDTFPNIYTMNIVQQDSNSYVAWQYDKIGNSGVTVNLLDETRKNNILHIRTHVDSTTGAASSFFSNCKRI